MNAFNYQPFFNTTYYMTTITLDHSFYMPITHHSFVMKKTLLIFSLITASGIAALTAFFYFTIKAPSPLSTTATQSPAVGISSSNSMNQYAQRPTGESAVGIPVRRSPESSSPPPEQLNLDSALPAINDSYSTEDIHDIMFVIDIMDKMIESGDLTMEQLLNHTEAKGFQPYIERRGHMKTGYRQVIKIKELEDPQRIVREFHGSYYEQKGELVFDRFYYGLEAKPNLYEQIVQEIDERVGQNYSRKLIQKSRSRWDLDNGSFIFIHAEHTRERNSNNKIILIGKEWEIHH